MCSFHYVSNISGYTIQRRINEQFVYIVPCYSLRNYLFNHLPKTIYSYICLNLLTVPHASNNFWLTLEIVSSNLPAYLLLERYKISQTSWIATYWCHIPCCLTSTARWNEIRSSFRFTNDENCLMFLGGFKH